MICAHHVCIVGVCWRLNLSHEASLGLTQGQTQVFGVVGSEFRVWNSLLYTNGL